MRPQQMRIRSRTRSHDARHFPPHQFLASAGFFHLVANRHAIPAPDQPRNVTLCRVIRHAAHRNRIALFLVARGQRDLKLFRRRHRVFKKKFVEIAQAEHQQRTWNLLLDGMVLPHQRR